MADFVLTLNSDEQLLPIGRRFTGPQAESDSVVRSELSSPPFNNAYRIHSHDDGQLGSYRHSLRRPEAVHRESCEIIVYNSKSENMFWVYTLRRSLTCYYHVSRPALHLGAYLH